MMNGANTSETRKGGKREEPGESRFKNALKRAASMLMIEGAIFGTVAAALHTTGCGEDFSLEETKPSIPGKDAQDEKSPEAGEDAELDSETDGGPDAMDDADASFEASDAQDEAVDADEDAMDSSEDAFDSGEDALDSAEDVFEAGEDVIDSGEDALDSGEDVADATEDAVDAGEDALEAGDDASDASLDSGEDAHESGADAMEGGMDAADAPLDVQSDVSDSASDVVDAGIVCDGITATSLVNISLDRGVISWNGGYGSEYADLPFSAEGIYANLYCMSGGTQVKLVSEQWIADNSDAVWERPADGFTATLHLDFATFSKATVDFTISPQ